jgi:formamidopyrimidine-DNA glycosylase
MPELPEVQTTVSGLSAIIPGLVITNTWTDYRSDFYRGKDVIHNPIFFKQFKKSVIGKRISSVSRRAKNILIHLADNQGEMSGTILVHMKMTGHLLYGDYNREDPFNRFIHFTLTFSNNKTLELSDMRRFAKVTWIPATHFDTTTHLQGIGPEPLEDTFTYTLFKNRLHKKPNGKIKTVLMDQTVIAGIGNIYSDEMLWRAGIHPERQVESIGEIQLKKLFHAMKEVLNKGIDFGGDSMSDYRNIDGNRGKFQEQHCAYRRTGKKCDKKGCAGTIQRKMVGGRSAHFCDTHQQR